MKCCPEVVRTTICIHGADVCDGQASAGFAQSDGDGGDERVRLHAAADDPPERGDTGVERGDFVGHLRDGDVQGGERIAIEAAIAHVAGDADNLTRRLDENGTHIGADPPVEGSFPLERPRCQRAGLSCGASLLFIRPIL